jgi:hypothetical protein
MLSSALLPEATRSRSIRHNLAVIDSMHAVPPGTAFSPYAVNVTR